MKYYFGYYIINGNVAPYKRNEDSPPSPGATHEIEISKERFALSLEYLTRIMEVSKMKSL